VTSISFDFEKDGSIDRVERFSYDEQGRITSESIESDGQMRGGTSYTYFEDDLIKVETQFDVTNIGYENGRVVSIDLVDNANEEFNSQTLYLYDNSGRLTGTVGDTYLYQNDDCLITPSGADEADPEAAELTIAYAGNRISRISSDDGNFAIDFNYNSSNQLSGTTDRFKCDDFDDFDSDFFGFGSGSDNDDTSAIDDTATIDDDQFIDQTNVLGYDDAGRLISSNTSDSFDENRLSVVYDNLGRVSSVTDTDVDGFQDDSIETTTVVYTYNDQDLIVSIDSTSVDSDPGIFVTPSFIATIEYENESCVTAVTIDPLVLATVNSFQSVVTRQDPLLCTYPVD